MAQNTASEAERLKALRRYGLLDTPADGAFDRVTALAASFFRVPICVIALVDEDRVWFLSRCGVGFDELPRDVGLCASAVFSEGAYVVRDARDDPRTLAHPLVTGGFALRFYAAAPIVTSEGHRLGTFGLLDVEPRDFSEADARHLARFAEIVAEQIDLRLSARTLTRGLSNLVLRALGLREGGRFEVCARSRTIRLDGTALPFEEFLTTVLGGRLIDGAAPDAAAD